MKPVLSTIAGLLFLAGFLPYYRAIFRGETKPTKASWLIWATLDTITLVAMYDKGTVNGLIIGAVAGAWTTTALAFKYGVPGWTRLDKVCLAAAGLSIVLWFLTEEAIVAIVISQIATFTGSIPTFASAWKHPSREDRIAWMLYFLSCVVALFAIPAWTLEDAAQPINFFVIEAVMIHLVWIRPLYRRFPKPV